MTDLAAILRGVLRANQPAHPAAPAIHDALLARVGQTSDRAAQRRGTLVFDAGPAGAWTIELGRAKTTLTRGRATRPTSIVQADPETLLAVLEGRYAGVQAFLERRLFLRGNLVLALELDDLLPPPARAPGSPRCHRVMADGVQSFYLEGGVRGAPPIVLLHGLGATSASFLPSVWDLSRDYHVIVPDLPGFGETGKPVRRLHPEYFTHWLEAFLDAVALDRVHIVGNSMGGRIALEAGIRIPNRVDRLVLLAPSLAWRRYRAAAGIVRLLRPELAAMPLPALHRLAVVTVRSLFAYPARIPDTAVQAAADEFVRVFATPRGRIAFFHAAREIYLEDPHGTRGFWDRLSTLERPSLFLFGGHDWLVPRAFLRHVRRTLPSARWEVFEDCGHVPQFEVPDRTHARIREFLRSTP